MRNFTSALNSKLLIFKSNLYDDGAGGSLLKWLHHLTLFSNYNYSNNKHIFSIRYRIDIQEGMKILFNEKSYIISEITITSKRKSLKLLTRKIN